MMNLYDCDYQNKLKKHHLCIRCRKQDAYTIAGRSLCFECAEYQRKRQKTKYEQDREKFLSWNREKRLECIKNNICSKCLKRKTDGIHKVCEICRQTLNAKRRAKTTYSPGLVCYHCHKPLDGQKKDNGLPSKLCSRCYAKAVKIAIKNSKNRKKKGSRNNGN